MLNELTKKVQLLANLATIVIAILLCFAVTRRSVFPEPPKYAEPAPFVPVHAGTKLALPGIDWAKNERTLLLALSQGCHFCTASAPFYQRLTQELSGQKNIGLVALLPQPVDNARTYLTSLGVAVADVRQVPLDALGVVGTPTLILVNKEGVVIDAWRGQLPSNKEQEVLSQLKCDAAQPCG
ncbi:MAG: peroxiredoxin family protein [Pyrinomonadaceae bacterium]